MKTRRVNLALKNDVYEALRKQAIASEMTLTGLINVRLEKSLTFEERFSDLPAHFRDGVIFDENIWIQPLPKELQRYKDELDYLGKLKNMISEREVAVHKLYEEEVSAM